MCVSWGARRARGAPPLQLRAPAGIRRLPPPPPSPLLRATQVSAAAEAATEADSGVHTGRRGARVISKLAVTLIRCSRGASRALLCHRRKRSGSPLHATPASVGHAYRCTRGSGTHLAYVRLCTPPEGSAIGPCGWRDQQGCRSRALTEAFLNRTAFRLRGVVWLHHLQHTTYQQ